MVRIPGFGMKIAVPIYMVTASPESRTALATAPYIEVTPWPSVPFRPLMGDLSDAEFDGLSKEIGESIARIYGLEPSSITMSGSVAESSSSESWVQVVLLQNGEYWRGFRKFGLGIEGQIVVQARDGDIAEIVKYDLETWSQEMWNAARNRRLDSPCSVDVCIHHNDRIVLEICPLF
jgi:hypothetical protein